MLDGCYKIDMTEVEGVDNLHHPEDVIAKEQESIDIRNGESVRISVRGRHDPCIVRRAVPVVEAAAAAAILDEMMMAGIRFENCAAEQREKDNGT